MVAVRAGKAISKKKPTKCRLSIAILLVLACCIALSSTLFVVGYLRKDDSQSKVDDAPKAMMAGKPPRITRDSSSSNNAPVVVAHVVSLINCKKKG